MKKNLIVLLLLGRITFTIAQIPPYIPTNGLVAWYPFNGNANDESGNGNNGVVNGAILTADRLGNPNAAYDFNGVNNYISVIGNSSLHNIADSMSCSIWIFAPPFTPTTETAIAKTQSLTGFGFSNNIYHNTDQCEFRVVNAAGLGGVYTTSPIITSSWHNIVSVVSSTTRSIYYDGMLNTSTTAAGYYYGSNTGPLTIGCHTNLVSWYLGKIDDIGIWNRPLTAQEVLQIYNSTITGINEPLSLSSFGIYPNPNKGTFTITTPNISDNGSIEIYSVLGERIFSEPVSFTSKKEINIKNISQGIYFVKVFDEEKSYCKKLIVSCE